MSCLLKALKVKFLRCSETVNRFNTMSLFRAEPCKCLSRRLPLLTRNHSMSQSLDMNPPDKSAQIDPYTLLRAALALFKKTPDELQPDELRQAEVQAINEFKIESRILNAPEA